MPKRYRTDEDKNFDDLAHRFENNIYGRLKGDIRLAILQRDLTPFLDQPRIIVDAGGGQGQLAMEYAKAGHHISLCDISEAMLAQAKKRAEHESISLSFIHAPLQDLHHHLQNAPDIILCHAVLEWLSNPLSCLPGLFELLKPGGILSLAFFNEYAITYKNLLRANFHKVDSGDYVGTEGSLTPLHPLKPEIVEQACQECGFELLDKSGIRVFHDYMADNEVRNRFPAEMLKKEVAYSKHPAFIHLGRYMHLVLRKPEA